MADQTATSGTSGGEGANKEVIPVVQPQLEVRTVREVTSTSWPMLTSTNYGEWAVHMKWKLRARKLGAAVEGGGAGEEVEGGAPEALLASTPAEYHEAIGAKDTAKAAWEMLASFRVGSERAKKVKAQQLRREFDDLRFKSGESVEDFALRLQSLASQLATYRSEERRVGK